MAEEEDVCKCDLDWKYTFREKIRNNPILKQFGCDHPDRIDWYMETVPPDQCWNIPKMPACCRNAWDLTHNVVNWAMNDVFPPDACPVLFKFAQLEMMEELPESWKGENYPPMKRVCGPNYDGTWNYTNADGVLEKYSVLEEDVFFKCQKQMWWFGANCYNRLYMKFHEDCKSLMPADNQGKLLWQPS